jgi:hypothetical protein
MTAWSSRWAGARARRAGGSTTECLYGDPGKLDVWQMLEDALGKTYAREAGERLRISAACTIRAATSRSSSWLLPGKGEPTDLRHQGMPGAGRPIVSAPTPGAAAGTAARWTLHRWGRRGEGSDLSRLKLRNQAPATAFPVRLEYDEEHFAQLTAEKIVTRPAGLPEARVVKTRPRNEALDCRVPWQRFYILEPCMGALARRAAKKDETLRRHRSRCRSRNPHGSGDVPVGG